MMRMVITEAMDQRDCLTGSFGEDTGYRGR